MWKTKTIASKKYIFNQIMNFFVLSPQSLLKVPWRSWALRPLGDLQGTSLGYCIPAGKAGIIRNIATCKQFTLKCKKNLIIVFENNLKAFE